MICSCTFIWSKAKTYMYLLFVVCLVGFLTSSSTTRLYRGRAPRQSVRQFYVLRHMRHSWETMTSVSAGHIIQTPTQPIGSGRPQPESNPRPPHQESRALPTELPRPLLLLRFGQLRSFFYVFCWFCFLTDKRRYRPPSPFMGNGGSARRRPLISD